MIIEMQTRRIIEDNGKCGNCKYNCGTSTEDKNFIYCCNADDYKRKDEYCEKYIFEKAEE